MTQERSKFATYEKQGHIGIVTMNRAEKLNAYTSTDVLDLHYIWQEVMNDSDVWVAILAANGRAFCSGHDLRTHDPLPEPASLHYGGVEFYKPLIAAIQGYCLGGGCSMALACDIRIAAEDAKFGYPQVTYGAMSRGGHQRLPRMITPGVAMYYMLTGELFDAQEAHRLGLVAKVVPNDQLMAETMSLAERLCKNAPLSMQATKEAFVRGREVSLREGLHVASLVSWRLSRTEDSKEGRKAWAERRQAEWKGR